MSVVDPFVNQVFNIAELKTLVPSPVDEKQYVYVDCHTTKYDDGGGFFYYTDYSGFTIPPDNNGTVIHPDNTAYNGAWFRVIDGDINIRYFGCIGSDPNADCSDAIISAMEHAASSNILLVGNTVFFPKGQYGVAQPLVLKTGVNLVGESSFTTILRALYTEGDFDYMITMDSGRIQGCNIANLTFDGNKEAEKNRGCMYFEANFDVIHGYNDGGMWQCTFKNLIVNYFNGNGIVFKGGGGVNYKLPNQFIVFENVQVNREKDYTYSLYMSGETGQITFINSSFGGKLYLNKEGKKCSLKGENVLLQGTGTIGLQPDVLSFINCTFQDSEYGILMENAQNITIDNCWFESLDLAITAKSNENGASKSINILNNMFANAAGFGSLDIFNRNTSPGRCITSVNSQMNVYNNYVTVSSLETDIPNPAFGKNFILAFEKNLGVRTIGNSFLDSRLGYTYGIMQYVTVESDPLYPGNYINTKDNKLVFVITPENPIDRIQCSINAGETISIRADQKSIEFTNKMNLFFSNQSGLKLNNGDIATFIKIDNIIEKYIGTPPVQYIFPETYQLISVIKSSSPL
jgi:hypothetical protein